jgi:hypothetical protein
MYAVSLFPTPADVYEKARKIEVIRTFKTTKLYNLGLSRIYDEQKTANRLVALAKRVSQ